MATTIREAALRRAITQLGVCEHPPGTNSGPMVNRYLSSVGLGPGYPWCMAFVHWCYQYVNGFSNGVTLGGYGSVEKFEQWAAANGEIVARPLRADIVCYDWEGNGWADHVGIVVKVLAVRWRGAQFVGWVKAIEGNTAVGNDSNGGKVMYRYRWIKNAKFARIPGVVNDGGRL